MTSKRILKITGTNLYILQIEAADTFVLTGDPVIASPADEILKEPTSKTISAYFPAGIEVVNQLGELPKYLETEAGIGISEKI
ncbi:hypothetical protein ESZ50_10280 [Weissella muntiaci]|uniref:Uncharacterized protein n=1 Tax=Weissella muntiaci TaxID=2508881 RepID=A0A6C2C398_9LACO|nr:hypothetical protein [Weissella muntiaci]TYC48006.1 hypothetical protein ESZ50_10280 [Weissella muntiaci]